ncbi:hypothetical protein KIPB_006728, partial [Kipferlia bialata]
HDQTMPLSGWRWVIMEPVARYLSRSILFVCGYHWIRVKGSPAPPCPPYQSLPPIVANHQSWTDIMVFISLGCYGFIAKQSVSKAPLVGYMARVMNVVFVKRDDPNSRGSATAALRERMCSPTLPRVVVFPEGTTTDGSCLLQYRAGAFRAGIPIQPCLIRYPHRWYAQSWDSQPFTSHLIQRLSSLHNQVSVTFMPVYQPSPEEIEQPFLYASNVRDRMRDMWSRVNGRDISLSPLSVKEKLIYQSYREGEYDWEECLRRYAVLNESMLAKSRGASPANSLPATPVHTSVGATAPFPDVVEAASPLPSPMPPVPVMPSSPILSATAESGVPIATV